MPRIRAAYSGETSAEKRRTFDPPLYVVPPGDPSERIELVGLSATMRIEEQPPVIHEMKPADSARYVLRNLIEGTEHVAIKPRAS